TSRRPARERGRCSRRCSYRCDARVAAARRDEIGMIVQRWFGDDAPSLTARWLWLRALGLIFFSVFYSLWFQIHGLIGPTGILPARDYILYAKQVVGARAYWLIPSLLWLD